MLPSGLRTKCSVPQETGSEDLAENTSRGFIANGSMPLQYFVDF
jgi:hypothetical protein